MDGDGRCPAKCHARCSKRSRGGRDELKVRLSERERILKALKTNYERETKKRYTLTVTKEMTVVLLKLVEFQDRLEEAPYVGSEKRRTVQRMIKVVKSDICDILKADEAPSEAVFKAILKRTKDIEAIVKQQCGKSPDKAVVNFNLGSDGTRKTPRLGGDGDGREPSVTKDPGMDPPKNMNASSCCLGSSETMVDQKDVKKKLNSTSIIVQSMKELPPLDQEINAENKEINVHPPVENVLEMRRSCNVLDKIIKKQTAVHGGPSNNKERAEAKVVSREEIKTADIKHTFENTNSQEPFYPQVCTSEIIYTDDTYRSQETSTPGGWITKMSTSCQTEAKALEGVEQVGLFKFFYSQAPLQGLLPQGCQVPGAPEGPYVLDKLGGGGDDGAVITCRVDREAEVVHFVLLQHSLGSDLPSAPLHSDSVSRLARAKELWLQKTMEQCGKQTPV